MLELLGMVRFAIALVLVLTLAACSASLRVGHRNTVFFERCHAADLDPQIRLEDRSACWARWLAHYTAGQPPDRRIYAWERRAALEQGEEMSPILFGDSGLVSPNPGPHDENSAGENPGNPQETEGINISEIQQDSEEISNENEIRNPCDAICQPRRQHCEEACVDRTRGCIRHCVTEYEFCRGGCF